MESHITISIVSTDKIGSNSKNSKKIPVSSGKPEKFTGRPTSNEKVVNNTKVNKQIQISPSIDSGRQKSLASEWTTNSTISECLPSDKADVSSHGSSDIPRENVKRDVSDVNTVNKVRKKRTSWSITRSSEDNSVKANPKRLALFFTRISPETKLENFTSTAEAWLKKQAQELGWSKATKLEGRQTSQGLIGVAVDKRNAALVEINCETDFVARNKEFKHMVEEAVKTCLAFTELQKTSQPLMKFNLNTDELKKLKTRQGITLADMLALMIGTVGENASLKRALCLKVEDHIKLVGYAHPSTTEENTSVLLGRFGGVVALKPSSANNADINEVGKGICQHVVGMAPKKIGSPNDEPSENKDDEVCLIHQEYLLDETVTVKELLEENNLEVIDINRFECGECVVGDQPLDLVETCQ